MDRASIARAIRDGRAAKGLTQQELADLTGISLRSVQRIEGGEVLPRAYTMRVLGEKLDLGDLTAGLTASDANVASPADAPRQLNKPRKVILTIGIGLLLFFVAAAFVAQSRRFPETQFEGLLYWGAVLAVYVAVLFRIWR